MENLRSKFQVLEPNTLIQELVNYIEQELPNFKDSQEFVVNLRKKKNENQHSGALCLYMTNLCKSKFNFQRETSQKGSRTIDIGIYKGSNLIFTVEAKLLPTPPDPERNEYEYVYGKGAGIQRFKDGHHGVDEIDDNIYENGLIAYITESDFSFWYGKVNQWISDANWNDAEKLETDYFKHIGKLKSKHERLDSSEVLLHHFWVYVK
jgi:hypothetical protein